MIISSELTGKTYKTVDECLEAEAIFVEEQKKKQEAERLRSQELDKAYKEAIAACDRYLKLAGVNTETLDLLKFFGF